jgi:hypothetical protein
MRKLFAVVLVLLTTTVVLTDSLNTQVLGVQSWMWPYLDPDEPVHSGPGRVKVSRNTLAEAGIILGHRVTLNADRTAVIAITGTLPTPHVIEFNKTTLGCAVDLANFLKMKTPLEQEFQPITLDAEHLYKSQGNELEVLKRNPVTPSDWRVALHMPRDYDVRWFVATRQAQKQITYEDLPTSFVITPQSATECDAAYEKKWPTPTPITQTTQYTEVQMDSPRQ